MSEPLVSVIIPFYNEERYVADAINSILSQTYSNLEVLLIDDNSIDRSLEICRGYSDPRLKIITKGDGVKGLAASRNLGVTEARGEFVAMQDADDVSSPERIARQMALAMEDPHRRVVGCAVRRVKEGSSKLLAVPEDHDSIVKGFTRLYNRTTIVCATILAPRELLARVPYRTQFKYMQDWDHVLRLSESGLAQFRNCPEPLYTYFIRSKGVLYRPDWLDYNILVRHCQRQRALGRPECGDLAELRRHLEAHPAERIRWGSIKSMIRLRDKVCKAVRKVRGINGGGGRGTGNGVEGLGSLVPKASTNASHVTKVWGDKKGEQHGQGTPATEGESQKACRADSARGR